MVDWFRVIVELERHMTLQAIGDQIGRNGATIYRYKAEITEPRHSDGEKILRLHHTIVITTT